MLYGNSYSSGELGRENFQSVFFSPCKLQILQSSVRARDFLGFSFHSQNSAKSLNCAFFRTPSSSSIEKSLDRNLYSHTQKQRINHRGARVFPGFKLHCSRTVVLPTKSSSSRKKKYSGVLPSILRALESESNIEDALNSCGKLSPKEQTVILKEQSSWKRVLRVFDWIKSQEDYVPNVIHYNVVLRVLGRAQKWDELRLCWIEMAKSSVLPSNNTYGMLVDVYGKAGLVKEALFWIKHMKLRGVFPDEVTMNTVVRVLKDAGKFDWADRFYRDWCVGKVELGDLDSVTDSDNEIGAAPVTLKHFLSTELFKIGSRRPIAQIMDSSNKDGSRRKPRMTATYNTLIDLYGKAGRLRDAAEVFAEMLKLGVSMDTITFNTMIFTCGSHGHLQEAEALVTEMEERGILPDTKTYNIFLSLYADVGDIDAALKCYRKIREVGLFPDAVTYRAVLHVLCERNMVGEVETVIAEMKRSGVQIDELSIPVLIKMYVSEGLLDKAKFLWEELILEDEVSSRTSVAVMDAYAEKGLWMEAENVFFRKRDSRWQKDVLEYNVMIKAYGKAKLYDKAFSLFKAMRNHGTWPSESTYNSLIQMFSGGDLVDQARDTLAEMQKRGFKPQCLTFSAVIACYARLGRLPDAVEVYEEMIRAGIKPNEVVYGSLINGFSETGNVEEALRYFRKMDELGISVNQIVLTSLIKAYSKVGCLEGAKTLYEGMKDLDGGPDIVASNSMINLYADLGLIFEAKLIFDDLRQKGRADGVSFATMMYLYKNLGLLDEAIDVAEEMKQSGFLRDCASFNKVMACYATNGQLSACGELLNEMITKRILPDAGTFRVMFMVLKKGGLPREAVLQLESSYQEGKPYARHAVIASLFSTVGLHAFAVESCETFLKSEVALDSSFYNVAIHVYGASGAIDKALKIFMKMQDEGLEPDLVTYINLAGCYGKAGMLEGLKRIYSQLKYREVEPNESLFKALIDAYRSANRYDLAELVSQEMKFAFDSNQYIHSESELELDEPSSGP